MKFLFGLFLGVFALNAHADQLSLMSGPAFAKFCADGVTGANGQWFINRPQIAFGNEKLFVSRRGHSSWTLESIDTNQANKVLATFASEIRDIKFASPLVWVATSNYLTAINSETGKIGQQIKTAILPAHYPQHNQIGEFVIDGGIAYVAQGAMGIIKIDLQSGRILQTSTLGLDHQAGGHQSKVVGLSQNGSELIAIVDSVTMPTDNSKAFNGIIRVQAADLSVVSQSPSDGQNSMTQVMSTHVSGSSLYLDNWGAVQKIDLGSLGNQQTLSAQPVPFKAVYNGVTYSAEALGDLASSGHQVSGCAVIANDDNVQKIPHRTGVAVQAPF